MDFAWFLLIQYFAVLYAKCILWGHYILSGNGCFDRFNTLVLTALHWPYDLVWPISVLCTTKMQYFIHCMLWFYDEKLQLLGHVNFETVDWYAHTCTSCIVYKLYIVMAKLALVVASIIILFK